MFGFDNTQHSAVQIFLDAPPKINSVTVGTSTITGTDLGTPNATSASVVKGTLSLTTMGEKSVSSVAGNSATTVRYALGVSAPASNSPDWKAPVYNPGFPPYVPPSTINPSFTFAAGDVLWLEVTTSADITSAKTVYYAFDITTKTLTADDAKLTSLLVGGAFGPGGVSGGQTANLGTPAGTLTGTIIAGNVSITQAEAAGNYTAWTVFAGTGEASFQYAVTQGSNPDTWTPVTDTGYGTIVSQLFADQDVLWVEGTAGTFKQYYKIVVTVTP
jgi:hypothetical protein